MTKPARNVLLLAGLLVLRTVPACSSSQASGGGSRDYCAAWDKQCDPDGADAAHCYETCGSDGPFSDGVCARAKCSVEAGVCGKLEGEQDAIQSCLDDHGWTIDPSTSSSSATTSSSSGMLQCDGSGECATCNDCSKYDDGPCAATLADCTADPMCDGYRTCINGQQEEATCVSMYPDGQAPYQALIGCICATCASDCGGTTLCP